MEQLVLVLAATFGAAFAKFGLASALETISDKKRAVMLSKAADCFGRNLSIMPPLIAL